jgi:hypothetical protein
MLVSSSINIYDYNEGGKRRVIEKYFGKTIIIRYEKILPFNPATDLPRRNNR